MTASPERPAGSARRLPDFFIVGHPKCGTSALYAMLKNHPQVFMPDVKEPRYFGDDVHWKSTSASASALDGYLSLFEPAEAQQRAGEATPLYLLSHTAAGAIAAMQPDARIIAILREPAGFLRSLHMQMVQTNMETEKDLRTALSLEKDRSQGRSLPKRLRRPQRLMYSQYVRYVEQLRRYHEVFPAQQVQVLIYDDFRSDNQATVRSVLRFLDVDDTAPIEAVEVNPTVNVRSVRLNDLVRGLYVGRGTVGSSLNAAVKAVLPQSARRRALGAVHRRVIYSAPQAPERELMLDVRRRYKGEVEALSEYLDRDLVSLWGYDRLG